MKLGVIGSRSFNDFVLMQNSLALFPATEIVSKGAVGADMLATHYATENNINNLIIDDNKDFLAYCHHIVAFWDGKTKGTGRTIDKIRKEKIRKSVV